MNISTILQMLHIFPLTGDVKLISIERKASPDKKIVPKKFSLVGVTDFIVYLNSVLPCSFFSAKPSISYLIEPLDYCKSNLDNDRNSCKPLDKNVFPSCF